MEVQLQLQIYTWAEKCEDEQGADINDDAAIV